MFTTTTTLSTLKAADLVVLQEDPQQALIVSLKGFSFTVVGSPKGGISNYSVALLGDTESYPFNALSDLKDYVRTCVAAYQEETQLPKEFSKDDLKELASKFPEAPEVAPKGWSEVEAGNEVVSTKPLQVPLSALVDGVNATGNLFFTKKTMKFFGDTLGNYGTRLVSIVVAEGEEPQWLVELYRKQPVKHNTQTSAYWDPKTFKRVHIPC